MMAGELAALLAWVEERAEAENRLLEHIAASADRERRVDDWFEALAKRGAYRAVAAEIRRRVHGGGDVARG